MKTEFSLATETAKQARSVWRELAATEGKHLVSPEAKRILVSGDCILTRGTAIFSDERGKIYEMECARRFEVNPEVETLHEDTHDLIRDLLHYGREVCCVQFESWRQAIPILLADQPVLLATLQRRTLK